MTIILNYLIKTSIFYLIVEALILNSMFCLNIQAIEKFKYLNFALSKLLQDWKLGSVTFGHQNIWPSIW
jgi:hypothetical protein